MTSVSVLMRESWCNLRTVIIIIVILVRKEKEF